MHFTESLVCMGMLRMIKLNDMFRSYEGPLLQQYITGHYIYITKGNQEQSKLTNRTDTKDARVILQVLMFTILVEALMKQCSFFTLCMYRRNKCKKK